MSGASLKRSERTSFYLILMICMSLNVKCDEEKVNNGRVLVCDDGVSGIGEDLEDFKCHGDKYTITYDFPAGYSNCTEHTQQADHICMSSPITYNITPPSSGAHRMIWPRYGEYDYCPPQRWVHSLEHGAVVFLYHPCTPADQIAALKRLAKSCLWKHIITSYPHLDQQHPMALVTWGCVYHMSWVEVRTAEEWIKQHALHSPEGHIVRDGTYNHGLQHPATIVSDNEDSVICPKHHHPAPVATTEVHVPTPAESTDDDHIVTTNSPHDEMLSSTSTVVSASNLVNELSDENSYATEDPSNHTSVQIDSNRSVDGISILALTLLSGTMAILLVLVMLCVLWRRYPPRRRYGRYKSFLPMSLRTEDGGIAIPTIGLPRSSKAEAEILIPADEDDEI